METILISIMIIILIVVFIYIFYKIDFTEELQDDYVKIQEKIQEISKIQSVVDIVENALDSIRNNKHFKIIELKYFQEMTHEEIAEELYINEKTVRRNKNYLIKQLQLCIFQKIRLKSI